MVSILFYPGKQAVTGPVTHMRVLTAILRMGSTGQHRGKRILPQRCCFARIDALSLIDGNVARTVPGAYVKEIHVANQACARLFAHQSSPSLRF
jgi:hypothetical protein